MWSRGWYLYHFPQRAQYSYITCRAFRGDSGTQFFFTSYGPWNKYMFSLCLWLRGALRLCCYRWHSHHAVGRQMRMHPPLPAGLSQPHPSSSCQTQQWTESHTGCGLSAHWWSNCPCYHCPGTCVPCTVRYSLCLIHSNWEENRNEQKIFTKQLQNKHQ